MAQQKINYGAAPNDGTGDLYRVAMIKIDNNFTDLYTNKVDKTVTIALSGGATGTATALSGAAVVIPVTGLNMGNATAGTLAVARGGTGVTTSTGTGANVQAVSPALTGTPTVPTAADTANSTQIASTAFVRASMTANGMLDIFGSAVDRYVSSAGTATAPYDDANTFPPGTRVLATRSFVANLPGTEALIYVETTANYLATAGRLQIGYGYQNGGCWMRWATSSNVYGVWQKFLMESGGDMSGQLTVLDQTRTNLSAYAANTRFVHATYAHYGFTVADSEASGYVDASASGQPATNDLNLMVGAANGGTFTLGGSYLNGPSGAASTAYTGILHVLRRRFDAGPAINQWFYTTTGIWYRRGTYVTSAWTWTAWEKLAFESSNVATASSAAKLTTARNITVGGTTKAFDGTGSISFSGAEIGVTGPNLLYNTDFLTGYTSSGTPNYWTVGGSATTRTGVIVPYLPYAGSNIVRNALRLACVSSTDNQSIESQTVLTSGRIDITPGTAYTLSTKFRGSALAEYRTFIQFRNSSGTLLSTINGPMIVTTGEWQTSVVTGIAPANTVDANIYIGRLTKVAASPSAMWLEVAEPQFQEGATATPYQPGLNAAALGRAGGLTTGTDWNTLLIDGDYHTWNTLATSYTNAPPTTMWGMLRVRRAGARIYQEYLTDTSPYVSYVRRSGDSGATWTAWASPSSDLAVSYGASQVAVTNTAGTNATIAAASTTQAGVMVAADKVKLDGIEAGATKDWTATPIATNGLDLNTYITPGNYSCAANSVSATLLNNPTTRAFSLNVYAAAGVVQVLTEYAVNSTTASKMWIRGIYSGIANAWQEVYTSGSPQLTTTTDAPGTNTTSIASTAFVQAAVSGVLSKTITGGAVTLTAAEASNAVIAFSGTLTSNATITFPTTVQRVWVVSNVTSGAFTLTVKSGTGNTVVVTQGRRDIVFSDGVNMNQADTDIVPVANGGTGVTTSTGTGSVVLSASPALTGNPTATTQAAADSSTRLATTAFVKSVTDPQATAISGKLGADWASIAGFISNGDEMYMKRSSDSKMFTIASRTGLGDQYFNGPVTSPTITSYGVGGFVKSGNYDAGGGLLAARVLSVSSLDAQTIFALLQPGVESSWRFDTGAANFYMKNSGVGYSAGGWAATSDNRVKYNVRPIESALDKICQLTGYTYIRQDMFDMQGNMPIRSGVIAQEVLKVLPSTVNVPANYDAEKNQGDLLSVSMDGLVGLLINAVKELRAEVEALKAGAV